MTARDLWIFGYGSLMWHPGFDPAEAIVASLPGYARSFCMRSVHHRGTEERPGLVLALDEHPDAECHGMAFRAPSDQHVPILAELRERELVSYAYLEKELEVTLSDRRRVTAVTYVIDPAHRQYAGGMELEAQAQIIARAHGGRGSNAAYLYNTAGHLGELGLADDELSWLAERVRRITSANR